MSTQDIIVASAQKYLLTRKKSPSLSQSLDVFIQVLAVDLGLKPALLYDTNSASSEQVQQYLSSLQFSQLVSKSLLTLNLNGNTLIINPATISFHISQMFCGGKVTVVDVSHSLEMPALCDPARGEFINMTQSLQLLLKGYEQHDKSEPIYVGEQCEQWNLCTVFGILLGYPVTYWFDQNKSFENCLSMTPLTVTTASATWQSGAAGHTCCFYSFSVPSDLLQETQSNLKSWNICLQEKFQQQHVLTDLTICQTLATLSSVCL